MEQKNSSNTDNQDSVDGSIPILPKSTSTATSTETGNNTSYESTDSSSYYYNNKQTDKKRGWKIFHFPLIILTIPLLLIGLIYAYSPVAFTLQSAICGGYPVVKYGGEGPFDAQITFYSNNDPAYWEKALAPTLLEQKNFQCEKDGLNPDEIQQLIKENRESDLKNKKINRARLLSEITIYAPPDYAADLRYNDVYDKFFAYTKPSGTFEIYNAADYTDDICSSVKDYGCVKVGVGNFANVIYFHGNGYHTTIGNTFLVGNYASGPFNIDLMKNLIVVDKCSFAEVQCNENGSLTPL